MRNISLAVPTAPEQAIIASVLDRETATLDTLIAKQERLIELLQEKRQAVISHAVTEGLNPKSPMKDSGVEWLGEVPAHWAIGRLSYVARVGNGSTPSRDVPEYWNGTIPWIASGKVNDRFVESAEEFVTERALAETSLVLFPAGTVLVGLIGQGRTRGMSAMLAFPSCINQNVAGVVPSRHVSSDFLLFTLTTAYAVLREFARGGQQDALNCELLSAFRIPLPPLDEQLQIVKYVGRTLKVFDLLIEKSRRSIDLMREHRTSLTAAAVTGKIDVRRYAGSSSSSAEALAPA